MIMVVGGLPTGTVTFLFTDIEGSTRLLDEHGERYAELLSEHRRVLREAFARHGGVQVDTQGDAFFVAFARASDAVAAAEDAQRALGGGPIRVRMGLHTGEPQVTAEGYVGVDVHRAARIAGAGHGGQVLVSQSTRDLAGASALRDLGEHRLKDLTAPERIYQLGEQHFPPLRTLNSSNLPLPATPLIGREKEVADVLRFFKSEAVRLVTVTGAGGVGKTRFALQVARELVEEFAHGVWLVDLSGLRDARLVPAAVGAAIGARGDLLEHVRDKELLLVLDNFEHVAEAAGDLAPLLRCTEYVQLLATSREPLQLSGERVYLLRPLAEPPAVELLLSRARDADPDFKASFDELAEIAARLDRLPLALELAAPWLRTLLPDELQSRLEQRLPLLTSRARDVPMRHRTLRATIEWSHDLLEPMQQELFRRLAVFAGGFDVKGADDVCGADLDTLRSLVDKNLVRSDEGRMAMLETIREFALAQLRSSGEWPAMSERHARFYLRIAETENALIFTPRAGEARVRVSNDVANLRAAFGHALEVGAIDLAARLALSAHPFPVSDSELARWLDAVVKRGPDDPALRALALRRAADAHAVVGESLRALELAEASLGAYEVLGDEHGRLAALRDVAEARLALGDIDGGRSAIVESIEGAEKMDDATAIYRGLIVLAGIEREHGDSSKTDRLLARAASMARDDGNHTIAAAAEHGRGYVAFIRGDFPSARAHYDAGLRLAIELRHLRLIAYCSAGLASAAAAAGEHDRVAGLWRLARASESLVGKIPTAEWTTYEDTMAALAPMLWRERVRTTSAEAVVADARAFIH